MAGFNDSDKLSQKRAEILKESGASKGMKNFLVMLLALAMVLVGAYLFIGKDVPIGPAPTGKADAVPGTLSHALAEFSDGQAHFYEYTGSGPNKIKYFLVQAHDGALHAALDACESCWPAGKGYKKDGDDMVCQNCRMRFRVENVGNVKGGCNPVPLPFSVDKDKVTIKTSDLEQGQHYFEVKK